MQKELCKKRQMLNKTKLEVAKDLGISVRYLEMLEKGDRTPSLKLAKKIASYYNEYVELLF